MATLSEMMARQKAEAEAKKGITNVNGTGGAVGGLSTGVKPAGSNAGIATADRGNAGAAIAAAGADSGRPSGGLVFLKRTSASNPHKDESVNEQVATPVPAQQPDADSVSPSGVLSESGQPEQVPPPATDGSSVSSTKPKLGFLGKPAAGVGGVKPDGQANSGNGAADGVGAGGLARLAGLTGGANGGAVSVSGGGAESNALDIPASGLSLADLDSFEGSGVVEFRPQYSDEVPATAPTRELPEDLDETQKSFVMLLNGIYSVLYDPELFGQMVRNIMSELQENPEYEKLLADEDVNAMMRGLRESMGMAKIKKAEKTKGGGRTGKAAVVKASALASTIDGMFDDGDFD